MLDPRVNAVRRDLADIRLAEYVFAPHYAAPMNRSVCTSAPLRSERSGEEVLAMLQPGDRFEALELAGGLAWGVAPGPGLVGYIDATALCPPSDPGAA